MTTTDNLLRWLPVGALAASLIAAGAVGQFQLGALAAEVAENDDEIEENEEAIESIQRRLIERQGEIGLDLERLKIQQGQQGEKLDEVLEILRDVTRGGD